VTPAQLRHLAEQLPAGAALTLDRATLLEVTAGVVEETTHTVATLAARLHRSGSTVRAWVERGLFPGAYKLPGDRRHAAWRIPQAALDAFTGRGAHQDAAQTTIGARVDTAPSPKPRQARARERADIGAWRRHGRPT
jgi:hypothetical protein